MPHDDTSHDLADRHNQRHISEQMLDALPDPIVYQSADGTLLFANTSARKNLQLPTTDGIKTQHNSPLFGEPEPIENPPFAAINSNMYQAVGIPVQASTHHATVVWYKDVRAVRSLETALSESEARLKRIIANIPGVVYQFVQPATGKSFFSFVSDGIEAICGVTAHDVYANSKILLNMVADSAKESFWQSLHHAAQTLEEWAWEGPFVDALGQQRWFQGRCRPHTQADGSIVWDGVLTDITSTKQQENEQQYHRQQRTQYQSALIELSRNPIVNGTDKQRALEVITETTAAVLNVERVSIWDYDPTTPSITSSDLFLRLQNSHEHGLVLTGHDFPAYFDAIAQNRTIIANDAQTDPATSEFADVYLKPLTITSMLDVPIRRGNSITGVLCLEHVGSPRTWTLSEEYFASSVADTISLMLQSQQRLQDEQERNRLQQEVIMLQESALAELSTPLIPLTDRVVLLPLIGSIDARRSELIIDTLLQGVSTHHSNIAIIDVTGVPVIDTHIANALIRAARSIQLLGANVMITGIRPELAQTLVSLGVSLGSIATYRDLQAGITVALQHR